MPPHHKRGGVIVSLRSCPPHKPEKKCETWSAHFPVPTARHPEAMNLIQGGLDVLGFRSNIARRREQFQAVQAHRNRTTANRTTFGSRFQKLFQPIQGTPAANQLAQTLSFFERRHGKLTANAKRTIQGSLQHGIRRSKMPSFHRRNFRRTRRTGRRNVYNPRRSTSHRARTTTMLVRSGITRAKLTGVGRSLTQKAMPFPPRLDTQITLSRTLILVAAGSTPPVLEAPLSIVLNSVEDPIVIPSSTQQPLYHDQLRAIYRDSVVLGCRYQIKILEYASTKQLEMYTTLIEGNQTDLPTDETAGASSTESLFMFDARVAGATETKTLTRYVSTSKFFSRDVRPLAAFHEVTGTPVTSNNSVRLRLYYKHLDNSPVIINTTLSVRINMTFYMQYSDRIKIKDS